MRRRAVPEECVAEVVRMYLDGHSLDALAATFDTTAPTVAATLRRAGVTLRPRGRPRRETPPEPEPPRPGPPSLR